MKKCKKQGCNNNVFSHLYCKNHQYLRKDSKYKKTTIAKTSKKMIAKIKDYSIVRNEYLSEHKYCEVCGVNKSTEIHHSKGRRGSLLCDKLYFLAVDRDCHIKIEENPTWAKDNKYSFNRL